MIYDLYTNYLYIDLILKAKIMYCIFCYFLLFVSGFAKVTDRDNITAVTLVFIL